MEDVSSTTEQVEDPLALRQFEWPEYLVFAAVLLMSMGIGVFYGCFGSKQKSNEDYLLGGRKMNPIPVALSLLCSYVSSITILGHTVEIYYFGTQLSMVLLCYIPLTLTLAYVMVPMYYQLQLTSVYEYVELRYHRHLRTLLSVINVIYTIFYMSIVVYGPALALEYVTGLDYRVYFAIIFLVCIFYSTLGGFKAVLWTDTLQAIIMFVSMAVVTILGITFIDGGLSEIWKRAEATGRITFFNMDPDPRTRHTFWTSVIGGYWTWLPMYANQAQIQRYVSLPSMKDVKVALLINLFGLFILMGSCYLCGLVIYGTYYNCDPMLLGRIKATDQILPVFVMDTLADYPGLPGLFVAGITCAGLSTVSSGVNSLAASITEDYVRKWRPNLTDGQLAFISKMTALVTGILSFGFCFVAAEMGSIFSAATTVLGILGGPTVGIFMVGSMFPWANTPGAIAGMMVSFAWMTFMGVGSTIAGNRKLLPAQGLPQSNACLADLYNMTTTTAATTLSSVVTEATTASTYWKDQDYSAVVKILSMSYMWYPAVGTLIALIFGLIFSILYRLVYGSEHIGKVKYTLFYPIVLKMWVKLIPDRIYDLVDFEDEPAKGTKEGKKLDTIFNDLKLNNGDLKPEKKLSNVNQAYEVEKDASQVLG